jgi:hypothetical protein
VALVEARPELHSQTTKALISIRDTLARIKKLPPDYDFQLPTLISHADDYSDDLPRLRRYAGQVIGSRIKHFGYTVLYKTYYFLDMFLRGYSDRNIYEMVFASRALSRFTLSPRILMEQSLKTRGTTLKEFSAE